jgi:phosphatidylinositol 3-kinase
VNLYQRLYHQLAQAQGPGKSALLKDSNITETLNKVKAIPPLSELTTAMKTTICHNASHCLSDPALMPALFRSVNWVEDEEGRTISAQLLQCKPVDVEYALEFFTKRYNQQPVREFAVSCIGSVERFA